MAAPNDQSATPPQANRLLLLPSHLRQRIYLYVGLASWHGRPFTFDLHGGPVHPAPTFRGFHGLLLCCRTIYIEAASLLYSANQFVIYYSSSGSLEPLRSLTATSLGSLARLKVILNQVSCHQPGDSSNHNGCCGDRSGLGTCTKCQHCHDRKSRPSISGGMAARAMLSEWHATAAYLSPYLSPKQLELSLVCDVDSEHGLDAAKLAVQPIRLFPVLQDCHVRLGKELDSRLREVAQTAALQSRGIVTLYTRPPPSSSAPRLLNLPREIRLHILRYTDLITPWKEVVWSREHRGYMVCHTLCMSREGPEACARLNSPDFHARCQFSKCWHNAARTPALGCFCRRHHSAFSSTCKCWAPPGPDLFLICRTLRQDAEFIFYSENRFVIHDLQAVWPQQVLLPPHDYENGPLDITVPVIGQYPNDRLAISHFLKDVIPTHCIPYLRFLELSFPPYPPNFWPQAKQLQDWQETVTWVQDKINAPALTVRLVMLDCADESDERLRRLIMTAENGQAILDGYKSILKPLKLLARDGLARFYAHLADPWAHTFETDAYLNSLYPHVPGEYSPKERHEWLDARRWKLKARTERCVMGDRYKTVYANDKGEPALSAWQHRYTSGYY